MPFDKYTAYWVFFFSFINFDVIAFKWHQIGHDWTNLKFWPIGLLFYGIALNINGSTALIKVLVGSKPNNQSLHPFEHHLITNTLNQQTLNITNNNQKQHVINMRPYVTQRQLMRLFAVKLILSYEQKCKVRSKFLKNSSMLKNKLWHKFYEFINSN